MCRPDRRSTRVSGAVIRAETANEAAAVAAVHRAAFGRPHEAALVDRLRATADPQVSLVALRGGAVVGHIFRNSSGRRRDTMVNTGRRECWNR